ncbi:MAG TPA: trimethylamine methyltransferase family protein [Actinomycetota bacterium]|nr:trimethylamine methyltransferase family protein [Actinomycetota bacterium]
MPTGWVNRLPRIDLLDAEQVEAVHRHAIALLEDVGVRISHEPALAVLRAAGLRAEDDLVRFDRGFVLERLASAPATFGVRGRDRRRDVTFGGRHVVLTCTGGAPFVLDGEGRRRPATMKDYLTFTRVVHASEQLHLSQSGVVEPEDVPLPIRHLEMDLAVIRSSDKPYVAGGVSAPTTRDVIDLAAIAFGGRAAMAAEPPMIGIVNPISPLQYDERMAGSLFEYARAGIPVVLMPFVFSGGTTPLSVPAALAQTTAEVLAGVALIQAIRPGTPCVFGASVSELDLHDGQPVYATGGHGLAMLASGQLARHYGLPFRGGGAFTASALPDADAMRESLTALWPALLSGANFLLHAAGWLEGSLAASLDKLALDLTALRELERIVEARIDMDEEAFAMDAFREAGPGGTFLGTAHTLRHLRRAVADRPTEPVSWQRLREGYEEPSLDPAVEQELRSFVEARRRAE